MSSTDQQRVAGWLALILQGPQGALGSAERVQFVAAGVDGVRVDWRGGPSADTVAEVVAAAAHLDPDMIELGISIAPPSPPSPPSPTTATVLVGPVPVVLTAADPDPNRPATPVHGLESWAWPSSLWDVGVACDSVLWVNGTPAVDATATVVRLPTSPSPAWTESGYWIADVDHQVPSNAAPSRHSRWERALAVADIRLRVGTVPPGAADVDLEWVLGEAERWMTVELAASSAQMVAVILPAQRLCLMRVRLDLRSGMRIAATLTTGPQESHIWSVVPAAVLDCLSRDPTGLPEMVAVRPFGDGHARQVVHLANSLVPIS